MTLMEYFQTDETVLPQELAFGEFRVADAPSPHHQRVVAKLFLALHDHLRTRLGEVWLAPLDVVLDTNAPLVVQPDLFALMPGGPAVVLDRVFGAPDLVIEVLSPRPRIGELAERVHWFRDYGVRECWLVHHLTCEIEVLQFANREVASRRRYRDWMRIESGVLPEVVLSPNDVCQAVAEPT